MISTVERTQVTHLLKTFVWICVPHTQQRMDGRLPMQTKGSRLGRVWRMSRKVNNAMNATYPPCLSVCCECACKMELLWVAWAIGVVSAGWSFHKSCISQVIYFTKKHMYFTKKFCEIHDLWNTWPTHALSGHVFHKSWISQKNTCASQTWRIHSRA